MPRESHGQRSTAGYSTRGHKELDMTERLTHTHTHTTERHTHTHTHTITYKVIDLSFLKTKPLLSYIRHVNSRDSYVIKILIMKIYKNDKSL